MGATSEYVATEVIHLNGARAFNPGDPVPEGHVEKYSLKNKVARPGTKAAAKATTPESEA